MLWCVRCPRVDGRSLGEIVSLPLSYSTLPFFSNSSS